MKDIKNNAMISIGSPEISLNSLVQSKEIRNLVTQIKELNLSVVASKATYDPGTQTLTLDNAKMGVNIVLK